LRAAFGGGDDKAGGAVRLPLAGFDFVAVLAAGAARDKELHVAITLERFAVGRISFRSGGSSARLSNGFHTGILLAHLLLRKSAPLRATHTAGRTNNIST
jgi:hypothetical protein